MGMIEATWWAKVRTKKKGQATYPLNFLRA